MMSLLNVARKAPRHSVTQRGMSSAAAPMFEKILVANRGEIACRIMRTTRRLGVRSVAIYSDADENAQHVKMADEAFNVGPAAASDSYLRADRIIDVCRATGAQAVHPGYGFLSENAEFARQLAEAGITFIGPPEQAILDMGSKSASKAIMIDAGVPVTPGYHGEDQAVERLSEEAGRIGYPVMIKAVMGGGGKGMRVVHSASEFADALASCQRESAASFGDDRVLLEKYLVDPRHVEVQVFSDGSQGEGGTVYLFERDCSVQRRHQKVLEEAPAPHMSEALRRQMGEAAVAAAEAVSYKGAGTVEFMLDRDGSFYFCEMNTRLQVEHPVTEMVTGQDLVEWQLRVAAGGRTPLRQEELTLTGHAIEARVYAENPRNNFLPATGRLSYVNIPGQGDPSVRVDTGVLQGDTVSVHYDPMIAKLIVRGEDRATAISKLAAALRDYRIVGVPTNLAFLERCCTHAAFREGDVHTGFIEQHSDALMPTHEEVPPTAVALAAASIILRRRADSLSAAGGTGDPTSPWAYLGSFRATHDRVHSLALAAVKGAESDEVVPVHVEEARDGSMHVSVEGADPIEVQNATLSAADGSMEARVNGERMRVHAVADGRDVHVFTGAHFEQPVYKLTIGRPDLGGGGEATESKLTAPMPGKVIQMKVAAGQAVQKGDTLVVMEAMKMEHVIKAPFDGTVEDLHFGAGDSVEDGAALLELTRTEVAE